MFYITYLLPEGILTLRHLKHLLKYWGKFTLMRGKQSNINIHVINKNRLNGKLKILHLHTIRTYN
jgi:hypothetical protein